MEKTINTKQTVEEIFDDNSPYTAEEIYEAYMKVHGAYLPCNKSVVDDFIKNSPLVASSPDLKFVVNMLFDYVGANQAYEEGSEEAW